MQQREQRRRERWQQHCERPKKHSCLSCSTATEACCAYVSDRRLSRREFCPGLLQEDDPNPPGVSAYKAKSSVPSQLSGLENVLFNDFIDDEPDSEDEAE
jgi:hypothetical protein